MCCAQYPRSREHAPSSALGRPEPWGEMEIAYSKHIWGYLTTYRPVETCSKPNPTNSLSLCYPTSSTIFHSKQKATHVLFPSRLSTVSLDCLFQPLDYEHQSQCKVL